MGANVQLAPAEAGFAATRSSRAWRRASAKVTRRPALLVPELQAHRADALPEGEDRDLVEDLVLVVRALEVVVRDARVQVVDVVQADVPGEELQRLRQLQVRAAPAARPRCSSSSRRSPSRRPRTGAGRRTARRRRSRRDHGRELDQQVLPPADREADPGDHDDEQPRWSRSRCGASAWWVRRHEPRADRRATRPARCRTSPAGGGTASTPRRPRQGRAWYSATVSVGTSPVPRRSRSPALPWWATW